MNYRKLKKFLDSNTGIVVSVMSVAFVVALGFNVVGRHAESVDRKAYTQEKARVVSEPQEADDTDDTFTAIVETQDGDRVRTIVPAQAQVGSWEATAYRSVETGRLFRTSGDHQTPYSSAVNYTLAGLFFGMSVGFLVSYKLDELVDERAWDEERAEINARYANA